MIYKLKLKVSYDLFTIIAILMLFLMNILNYENNIVISLNLKKSINPTFFLISSHL